MKLRVWEPEGKRTSVTLEANMGSWVLQRWSLQRETEDGMRMWTPEEKMWLTDDCIRTIFGEDAVRSIRNEDER
jgi:hypothetical protein